MSNEVKPVPTSPDINVKPEAESPVELSEGELQTVSAGIIAVLAPKATEGTPEMRKAGGDPESH